MEIFNNFRAHTNAPVYREDIALALEGGDKKENTRRIMERGSRAL